MSSLRCIVIDDEPHANTKMEQFVKQTPYLKLVASFINVLEAIDKLNKEHVDLVFLDIHMPELSGMEVLKMIHKDVMVILTTGYSEYAIEGFEYNVQDYLLKPITYPRFLKAAQKAFEHHSLSNTQNVLPKSEKDYLFIKGEHKGRQIKIDFKDIDYIEGEKNYIRFHCEDTKHMVVMNMKDVETLLPHQSFVRVHNSFIIPIKKINAIEGNFVILNAHAKNKISIPIGQTFKAPFLGRISS